MRTVLDDCRRLVGPAPRRFGIVDWSYLVLDAPPWVEAGDPGYVDVYAKQKAIRTHGTVVWGVLVHANEELYDEGRLDCPAVCVYSLDGSFDGEPSRLAIVARSLFALKGQTGLGADSQRIGDYLADEYTPFVDITVPEHLAAGAHVVVTSLMVNRKYLPAGYLCQRYFPLLVTPDVCAMPLVLPSRYWPDDLQLAWVHSAPSRFRASARAEAARLHEVLA